jgi:hypothetical protein
MKTAKEILKEKGVDDKLEIDTSKPFPEGIRYVTSEAMEEYADQERSAERERIKSKIRETKGLIFFQDVIELIDSL